MEKISREPMPKPAALPEKLDLLSIGETWLVVYRTEPVNRIRLQQQPHGRVLMISGKLSDHKAVIRALKTWLKGKACSILPARLEKLSRQFDMPYHDLTIRDQKTRWGSCSTIKNINLNLKLILLPPELVDYVLIHELCHTRVLSHSAVFWRLVGSCYPDYKSARKQLREISRLLPI